MDHQQTIAERISLRANEIARWAALQFPGHDCLMKDPAAVRKALAVEAARLARIYKSEQETERLS